MLGRLKAVGSFEGSAALGVVAFEPVAGAEALVGKSWSIVQQDLLKRTKRLGFFLLLCQTSTITVNATPSTTLHRLSWSEFYSKTLIMQTLSMRSPEDATPVWIWCKPNRKVGGQLCALGHSLRVSESATVTHIPTAI